MLGVNVIEAGGQLENSIAVPAVPEIIATGPDIRLSFPGVPTNQYALQWTHDLTPVMSWSALVTNPAATNRLVIFTNTPSADGLDFYRVRLAP